MMRLAAVTVDLDELEFYEAIHGIAQTAEGGALHESVFGSAVARLVDWAAGQLIPVTWFVVGRDATREAVAPVLRSLVRRGDELGNHSFDHAYDLTRRGAGEILDQVCRAQAAIQAASGVRPVGFRAPGYTVTDELLGTLAEVGFRYDASVFPCPPYYLSKALVLGVQSLVGRRSHSILDSPSVLAAPTRPYHIGSHYWRSGAGMLEIPVQVTRTFRIPFIGTTLALSGPRVASYLARSLIGEPLVNLELHAIDALDAGDGLGSLARYQPDLRRPWSAKLKAFSAALDVLRRAGYAFVTLTEASKAF